MVLIENKMLDYFVRHRVQIYDIVFGIIFLV